MTMNMTTQIMANGWMRRITTSYWQDMMFLNQRNWETGTLDGNPPCVSYSFEHGTDVGAGTLARKWDERTNGLFYYISKNKNGSVFANDGDSITGWFYFSTFADREQFVSLLNMYDIEIRN
jgi:hypothetical protein